MFLKIKKIIKSVEVKNVIINLSEKFLTFLLLLLLGKYLSVEKYGRVNLNLFTDFSLAISSGAVIHKAKEYFAENALSSRNLRP